VFHAFVYSQSCQRSEYSFDSSDVITQQINIGALTETIKITLEPRISWEPHISSRLRVAGSATTSATYLAWSEFRSLSFDVAPTDDYPLSVLLTEPEIIWKDLSLDMRLRVGAMGFAFTFHDFNVVLSTFGVVLPGEFMLARLEPDLEDLFSRCVQSQQDLRQTLVSVNTTLRQQINTVGGAVKDMETSVENLSALYASVSQEFNRTHLDLDRLDTTIDTLTIELGMWKNISILELAVLLCGGVALGVWCCRRTTSYKKVKPTTQGQQDEPPLEQAGSKTVPKRRDEPQSFTDS